MSCDVNCNCAKRWIPKMRQSKYMSDACKSTYGYGGLLYAHRIPVHNFARLLFCTLFSLFRIESFELNISWNGAVEGWKRDPANKITNLIIIFLIFATRCQCRVSAASSSFYDGAQWMNVSRRKGRKKQVLCVSVSLWIITVEHLSSFCRHFFASLPSLCIFKRNSPSDTQPNAMVWNINSRKLWGILLSRKNNDEFQRKMISIFYGHSYSKCTRAMVPWILDTLARKSLTSETQTN